jgi:hypothetical protein
VNATTAFGTLTDYKTGTVIRPATAAEWRKSADDVEVTGRGIFDLDGRTVFVEGGPDAEVTDDDIRELAGEAAAAGDASMARCCEIALGADTEDEEPCVVTWDAASPEGARREAVRVILDNRANSAE